MATYLGRVKLFFRQATVGLHFSLWHVFVHASKFWKDVVILLAKGRVLRITALCGKSRAR